MHTFRHHKFQKYISKKYALKYILCIQKYRNLCKFFKNVRIVMVFYYFYSFIMEQLK